jgi:hypothetical protein
MSPTLKTHRPTALPTAAGTEPTPAPTESEIEKIVEPMVPVLKNLTKLTSHIISVTVDLSFPEVVILVILFTGCCSVNLVLLARLAATIVQLLSFSTHRDHSGRGNSYLSSSEHGSSSNSKFSYRGILQNVLSLGSLGSGSAPAGSSVQRNRHAQSWKHDSSERTTDRQSGLSLLADDDGVVGDDRL